MENKLAPDSVHNHTHNAPQIGDNSPQAIVHDRTGLLVAICAFGLACIAIGIALTLYFAVPQIVDAKVKAAVAQTEEKMRTTLQKAELAYDRQLEDRAELKARGYLEKDKH